MINKQHKCKYLEQIDNEGLCIWCVNNLQFFTTCIFSKPHMICPYIFNDFAVFDDDTNSALIRDVTQTALEFIKWNQKKN